MITGPTKEHGEVRRVSLDPFEQGGGAPATPRKRKWKKPLAIAGLVFGVGFLLLFMVFPLIGVGRPFNIPTGAMSPTIDPGDMVYMQSVSYFLSEPKRGDLVIFEVHEGAVPESDPENLPIYVKRLVGLPGETLTIRHGKLFVDGQVFEEYEDAEPGSFLMGGYLCQSVPEYVVPEDCYFMMGDNLRYSADSRFWGSVSKDKVIGKVGLRFWPLDRVGFPE